MKMFDIQKSTLMALSPLDGRYNEETKEQCKGRCTTTTQYYFDPDCLDV